MISGDRPSSPQYPEDAAQGLAGLTALARDRLPSAEGPHAVREAYARFRVAGERTESRRRARAIWAVSTGTVALAAAGALLLPILRRPAPSALSLRVEGGAVAEGGYVRAVASDGEPRLRFSDGTEVTLERATRARVAETDEHGARVLLEEGRARAHVVSRPRSRWIFDAGPCRVWVTGTRFDLRWSAARQVLEVALFHGNVTVEGPPAVAGVPMRAGQRLVMDVKAGTVRFGEIGVEKPRRRRGRVSAPGRMDRRARPRRPQRRRRRPRRRPHPSRPGRLRKKLRFPRRGCGGGQGAPRVGRRRCWLASSAG